MRRNKENIIFRILKSPNTFTVVAIFLIIMIGRPLYHNVNKQIGVGKEIDTLDKEIKNLETKNTELKNLITYLNSDEFAEEQARLNLNYKKSGEEVVIIKDEDSNKEDESRETEVIKSKYNIKGLDERKLDVKKDSNYSKWFNYFWN